MKSAHNTIDTVSRGYRFASMSKSALTKFFLFVVVGAISGCGSAPVKEEPVTPVADIQSALPSVPVYLSELPQVEMSPSEDELLPEVSIQKLIAAYIDIIDDADNPELRLSVSRRLADLGMMIGKGQQLHVQSKLSNLVAESQLLTAENLRSYFVSAIDAYKQLLSSDSENEENHRLLYQLARAYDLEGMQDESLEALNTIVKNHPQSEFIIEVYFRRAEIFFSRGQYQQAEAAYEDVAAGGQHTPYYQNAVYMRGWAQLKRGSYEGALLQFAKIVDDLMYKKDRNELKRSKEEMLDDALRVMSLAFYYLDGEKSIVDLYKKIGSRQYEYLHYERLAELYLDKERYRESAETYLSYIKLYPLDLRAPDYHVKAIEALLQGDFPTLVRPIKEHYAKNYGVSSKFWHSADDVLRAEIIEKLKIYLPQFSSFYHALAQSLYKKGSELSGHPKELEIKRHFLAASEWYKEYIKSFPGDKRIPEMYFLQAEALLDAQDYTGAIAAYETTAYQYADYEKASEAAYSALLAYEQYLKIVDEEHRKTWHRAKIISQLKFVTNFGKDRRSHIVQLKAAQELFELEDYETAVKAATRVTQWEPKVAAKSRLAAWRVIAHSYFEMKQYSGAEFAYREVIKLISRSDPEMLELKERIAASIYKQGELFVEQNDLASAVEQYLRVVAETPNSPIRASAQYDAATHLLTLESWQRAINELIRFRRFFPNHQLVGSISPKLVLAYQHLEQHENEAGELKLMALNETDIKTQQNTLYLAAESYERAKNYEMAIDTYRDYANTVEEPFDQLIEAQNKLAELYTITKKPTKRFFWLRKIIKTHDNGGDNKTGRSLSLAAVSSYELATQHDRGFKRVRLKLPLKKSLKTKRELLKRAIKAYTKSASYGVQQYTTASTYKIAEIYTRLSIDLMKSERPKNLDALELDQYEILLEEQAFPFEETAIQIHEKNINRSWRGTYDKWVKESYKTLRDLLPGRYAKDEKILSVTNDIY